VGKVSIDKKRNPTKKAGIFKASVADGVERPTKKTAKTKKKILKGRFYPDMCKPEECNQGAF
jgi:hypothetical protein